MQTGHNIFTYGVNIIRIDREFCAEYERVPSYVSNNTQILYMVFVTHTQYIKYKTLRQK